MNLIFHWLNEAYHRQDHFHFHRNHCKGRTGQFWHFEPTLYSAPSTFHYGGLPLIFTHLEIKKPQPVKKKVFMRYKSITVASDNWTVSYIKTALRIPLGGPNVFHFIFFTRRCFWQNGLPSWRHRICHWWNEAYHGQVHFPFHRNHCKCRTGRFRHFELTLHPAPSTFQKWGLLYSDYHFFLLT